MRPPFWPTSVIIVLIATAIALLVSTKDLPVAPVWLGPSVQAIGMCIPVLLAFWPLRYAVESEKRKRSMDFFEKITNAYIIQIQEWYEQVVRHQSGQCELNSSRKILKLHQEKINFLIDQMGAIMLNAKEILEKDWREMSKSATGDLGYITNKEKKIKIDAPFFLQLQTLRHNHCLKLTKIIVYLIGKGGVFPKKAKLNEFENR